MIELINLLDFVLSQFCSFVFLSSDPSFVIQWLFLLQEILIMLLSVFPLTFCQAQTGMLFFIVQLINILSGWLFHDYFYWDGLHDHLWHDSWQDIFELSASAAVTKFYNWMKFMYISVIINMWCCHSSKKSHFLFVRTE